MDAIVLGILSRLKVYHIELITTYKFAIIVPAGELIWHCQVRPVSGVFNPGLGGT